MIHGARCLQQKEECSAYSRRMAVGREEIGGELYAESVLFDVGGGVFG